MREENGKEIRGVEGMGGREEGRGEAGKDGTVGKSREAKKLYGKCSSMQVMTVRQDGIIAHTTEEKK